VACLLAAAGCSPPSELAVDRETFIDVYVELRMAALDRDDATITEAERDEILASHEINQEDLFAFAEAHGNDPVYMLQVWEEIEDRLNLDPQARPQADSTG
jgi:hypothetical protein